MAPTRTDPTGRAGPTPRQVRGKRWDRCAPGLYVPTDRPVVVEQRIVEQAGRLDPARGAVTAWAALRWHGAAYFDGRGSTGAECLPVQLLVGGGNSRPHAGSEIRKTQIAPYDREQVDGVWVATVRRALFDEVVRLRPDLWASVAAVSMTYAADLITPAAFSEYVSHRCAWEGVPHVREVAGIARPDLLSPREVWLDLVWRLVARLAPARANRPVFGLDGTFLGIPDLLDVEAGMVAEYDGIHHLAVAQRRRDVVREALLREHGLEYVAVVRGDSRDAVAARLLQTRERARFESPSDRRWTLDQPEWWIRRHGTSRPA